MQPIKKTLYLPIFDKEVSVDVDFHLIEIVERVFELSADAVVVQLNDSRRVQRHKIADVIVAWLAFYDFGAKRREIRAYVMQANPELLSIYASSMYAALLFTLNYFDRADPKENAKKFDELVQSNEWPRLKKPEEESGKKKSAARAQPSSASATT